MHQKWKLKSSIITLAFMFLLTSLSVVQANRIDRGDKISLLEAITLLSKKYNVYFTYDRTLVSDVMVYYVHSRTTIQEELEVLLTDTEMHFKIFEEQFIILYKEDEEGLKSIKEMLKHFQSIINENEARLKPRSVQDPVYGNTEPIWAPIIRGAKELQLDSPGQNPDEMDQKK